MSPSNQACMPPSFPSLQQMQQQNAAQMQQQHRQQQQQQNAAFLMQPRVNSHPYMQQMPPQHQQCPPPPPPGIPTQYTATGHGQQQQQGGSMGVYRHPCFPPAAQFSGLAPRQQQQYNMMPSVANNSYNPYMDNFQQTASRSVINRNHPTNDAFAG